MDTPRPSTAPASRLRVIASFTPFLVIAALLYAAFFVRADAVVTSVTPPAIERRDSFLGVSLPMQSVIWAAGSNGKIVRSDDAGRTWVAQEVPVRVNLQAISAWSNERAIAVGNEGVVVRTDDSGKTWHVVDAPKSDVANKLLKLRTYDNGIAWAVGEMGAVLKTSDFGATWQRKLAEKDQAWNDIFFIGERGWLVGEFGQILRSQDGGETWLPVASGIESSLMSVSFRDAEHGVAVGLSGHVLRTDDGGGTWTALAPQTREHLNSVMWDGKRWMAVGDKGVLLTGTPSAEHWQAGRVSEGTLAWHTQIERVPTGHDAAEAYILAGADLSRLADNKLTLFGRTAE